MNPFSLETFQPLVGQEFRVLVREGEAIRLHLEAADPIPDRAALDAAGNRVVDGFSLLFVGKPETAIDQGIHALSHQAFDELEIFLTPVVSRDPAVRHYEAIFSWPVPPSEAPATGEPEQ